VQNDIRFAILEVFDRERIEIPSNARAVDPRYAEPQPPAQANADAEAEPDVPEEDQTPPKVTNARRKRAN
jgi:potassium efflux system protein